MKPIALLASLAFSTLAANAATYTMEGIIDSSMLSAIPEGATFRFTFDYDVADAVGDTQPGDFVASYPGAFTNATLGIYSSVTGDTVYSVTDTRLWVVITSVDNYLMLDFSSMSPSIPENDFVYGVVSFFGDLGMFTSDAPPVDPSALPWTFGMLELEFASDVYVTGTVGPQSFVPEPSSLIMASVGALGFLRRRR